MVFIPIHRQGEKLSHTAKERKTALLFVSGSCILLSIKRHHELFSNPISPIYLKGVLMDQVYRERLVVLPMSATSPDSSAREHFQTNKVGITNQEDLD
jgi:hypothetical protein